ncbi:MAG TPA: hypothetical protein VGM90_37525 [Kofleriaceae bacterium]|jgi:hypothetical protein
MRVVTTSVVIGLLGLAGGEAVAGKRAVLGDGYVLSTDGTTMYVTKGTVKARLGQDANDIKSTSVDKTTKDVTAKLEVLDCDPNMERTKTWTRAFLDARIENAAAYALHAKKNYAKAAEGFARAVADDPTWEIPAYNLASAKQMSGKQDDAMAALAPWLKSHPLQTYLQMSIDPELGPLLSRPELATLRAKSPGTAMIGPDGFLKAGVAINPDGVIAVTRDEHSWGGCGYGIDLELRDGKTGGMIAHVATYAFDDTEGNCDHKVRIGPTPHLVPKRDVAVAARITSENNALAFLGFAAPSALETAAPAEKPDTARFANAKLGVATSGDGVFRVLSKDSIVAQGNGLEHIQDAYYFEQPRTVVVQTTAPGREGCEGTDPTDITVIPLPAATIPATPAKPPAPPKPTH